MKLIEGMNNDSLIDMDILANWLLENPAKAAEYDIEDDE